MAQNMFRLEDVRLGISFSVHLKNGLQAFYPFVTIKIELLSIIVSQSRTPLTD